MEYRKAVENDRKRIADIIAVCFYDDLKPISKNTEKLARIFLNAIVLDNFYVLEIDGIIVAIAAASNNKSRTVYIGKKQLIKCFGIIKGLIVHYFTKKELSTPYNADDNSAWIEFVAVHPDYRGKGLSGKLISYIIENTRYTKFELDVKDTNAPAIKTYQRLGFIEIDKKPVSKYYGFNYKMIMSLAVDK